MLAAVAISVTHTGLDEDIVRSHRRQYSVHIGLGLEDGQTYKVAENAEDWGNFELSCELISTYPCEEITG